jgi:hypothetical protein
MSFGGFSPFSKLKLGVLYIMNRSIMISKQFQPYFSNFSHHNSNSLCCGNLFNHNKGRVPVHKYLELNLEITHHKNNIELIIDHFHIFVLLGQYLAKL